MMLRLSCISVLFMTFSVMGQWSLDSALIHGDSSISVKWTPDSANTDDAWYIEHGDLCTGSDTVYLHCDFLPGREYKGVAYSYGGEDKWDFFIARLDSGRLAGSHMCHYKSGIDPTKWVTGTDCSGFLCNLWKTSRLNTTGIINSPLFEKIDRKDLRTGDALVKGGAHCVFVVEADNLSEVVIFEASSTVFGCRERIINLTHSYWDDFVAIRNPAVTAIHPSTIHSYKRSKLRFTFRHNRYFSFTYNTDISLKFDIFSLQGQRVYSTTLKNNRVYNLEHLLKQSGIYIITTTCKNEKKSMKFILMQ